MPIGTLLACLLAVLAVLLLGRPFSPRRISPPQNGLSNALRDAAAAGDELKVTELLNAGASQTVVDEKGDNALMGAAKNGHAHCVSLLVGAKDGAQAARAKNAGHDTALIKAAIAGHLECVQILLPFSDPHVENNFYRTALVWAAQGDMECLRAILAKAPATALDANEYGETALMLAAHMGDEYLPAVEALLAHSNAGAQDRKGRTALTHAASAGRSPAIVGRLVGVGGAGLRDAIGFTPLIAAVEDRLLLVHFAAKHLSDAERQAQLRVADERRAQFVDALLPACELNAHDVNGRTALDWAEAMGFELCAEKLRAAGAASGGAIAPDGGSQAVGANDPDLTREQRDALRAALPANFKLIDEEWAD